MPVSGSTRMRRRLRGDGGFAMPAVMGGMLLVTIFVTVAIAAATGDLNLTRNDLAHRQAYEAARAGIADYAYNLTRDSNYWSQCTTVPTPNAVNQQGSTTKRRAVPGNSGATYAIELLPANGQSSCSTTNPVNSMIESTGSASGTFRIRSTGFADDTRRSIVATFKRASFLDYVYFTQLETSDPITYAGSSWLSSAYAQCSKTIQQGRYNVNIPNSSPTQKCDVISFINGETIDGPLHTNDALVVCGSPTFGRSPADSIEVSSPPQGWYSTSFFGGSSCGGDPNFVGSFITNAPVLTPPPTNVQLSSITQSQFRYTGQVRICLNGNNMTVGNGSSCTGLYSGAVPSNGLIYVSNGSCSSTYSPYTATYPTTSGCGNVYISGTYTSQLTIAAENDIIVNGNVCRGSCSSPTGNGMLGLIANNFIRVYHPVCPSNNTNCAATSTAQTSRGDCNDGVNGTGSISNLRIDAAMLAIDNSFIVDHYDCGSSLGTLSVNGAISQKFRGPVGTFSGWGTVSGYRKDYNYDDRLRSISPPHFLDPVQSSWHVQRQTLAFP